MDIATIVGIVGAIGLLAGAILMGHDGHAGDISAFLDPVGMGIVVGGSILTLFACMPFSSVVEMLRALMRTVFVGSHDHQHLVREIVELAIVARRDGLLALEQHITPATDPFLAKGIRLIVDGTDHEVAKRLMTINVHSMEERHKEGKMGLDAMGKYGPAYGMVGTLIGLVLMLGNLDDPDAIGPGMAVALLGTMYGCIVSSCIFLPLADKLAMYSHRELHSREMIIEGVMSIGAGDNPRIVEQKVSSFLSPREQMKIRDAAEPKPA